MNYGEDAGCPLGEITPGLVRFRRSNVQEPPFVINRQHLPLKRAYNVYTDVRYHFTAEFLDAPTRALYGSPETVGTTACYVGHGLAGVLF